MMQTLTTKDMDAHLETVSPGQPCAITAAAVPGDAVWQGDLGLAIVASVPDNYIRAEQPSCQLVPGSTQGSRHCLDSLAGVELYLPAGWPSVDESLLGPAFALSEERTVTHPVHGDVTIPAGFIVQCHYQREWDAEQRRARRNAD